MSTATPNSSDANVSLPPIEVLRVGEFVSAEGRKVSFTRDDLVALAETYDPAIFAAPHVVGHPRMDDPAYGLVQELAVIGDTLVASSGEVQPAFAEMIRAKRFSNRSVRVWLDGDRNSPVPGKLYLRHCGWLGAAAPAVKGLAPVPAFAADDDDSVTISLSEDAQNSQLKDDDKMTTAKGGSAADDTVSLAEERRAFEEERAAFAKQKQDDEQARIKAAHADNVSFVEGLIKGDGKVSNFKPADKDRAIFLLDTLAAEKTASFGEGDKAETPLSIARDMLAQRPAVMSFGAFDKDGGRGDGDEGASFAEPADLAAAARKHVAEQRAMGNHINIADAVAYLANKGG